MSHRQPSVHHAIDESSYVWVAIDEAVSNPFSATRSVTNGRSSNTTIYDFSWGAAGTSFNWDVAYQRAGDSSSKSLAGRCGGRTIEG